jgi:hypothetical protein
VAKNQINSQINLNINKDDSNLNDFLSCWDNFGGRPNKISIHTTYSTKLFLDLMDDKFIEKNTFTEIIPTDEDFVINDKFLNKISDFISVSFIIIDRNLDNSIVSDLVFYYKSEKEFKEVQKIVEELNSCLVDFCENESLNNLNTLQINNGTLEIEPLEIDHNKTETIELFYNQKTIKSVNKLAKKLKNNDKGLSIFYGEKGTGKTSILHYLSTKVDKIIIYIPINLIETTITDPSFRKFLRKYHQPIIVIDDCENIFNDILQRTNSISSNLIQMVDGLLSDYFPINVICIFNEKQSTDIDETLFDCNNFIDEIEFNYLTIEESEELSGHLGFNKKYKNKNKLVDIIKKRTTDSYKTIGF